MVENTLATIDLFVAVVAVVVAVDTSSSWVAVVDVVVDIVGTEGEVVEEERNIDAVEDIADTAVVEEVVVAGLGRYSEVKR